MIKSPDKFTEKMEDVTIVVVPFPAQSHLNNLLHLSLRLSTTEFSVHFASSALHNRQAKLRLQGWNRNNSLQNIHFHDFHLPSFPSPPPNPNSNSSFPSHLIPSFYASMELRSPLASLLCSLSPNCRRLVVIHDVAVPFASHEAALIPNAESYRFQCLPTFSELHYFWDSVSDSRRSIKEDVLDLILAKFDGTLSDEFLQFWSQQDLNTKDSGTLFNSCRAIEGEFLDLIADTPPYRGKKIFAVGPLNPIDIEIDARSEHECLKWLNEQPENSVVYVSFGSTTTISTEQIKQLAIGLKSSGQRFIWVLKDADHGNIFEETKKKELPSGFEENAKETGFIVRGWAPQLEILAHPSTGVFVSHCGWSSCMESLSNGVPMIAWPMHSDQPRNAMMVCECLRVGVLMREWGRRQEVMMGGEIEEVIKRMMVDEEGKEIRMRAKSVGEEARIAVSDVGSAAADFESFIAHISR